MMLQPQLHHFFCLYFKLVTNIKKMAQQAFCNELRTPRGFRIPWMAKQIKQTRNRIMFVSSRLLTNTCAERKKGWPTDLRHKNP